MHDDVHLVVVVVVGGKNTIRYPFSNLFRLHFNAYIPSFGFDAAAASASSCRLRAKYQLMARRRRGEDVVEMASCNFRSQGAASCSVGGISD